MGRHATRRRTAGFPAVPRLHRVPSRDDKGKVKGYAWQAVRDDQEQDSHSRGQYRERGDVPSAPEKVPE